ncbi:MAG: hypothetical protein IPL90_12805 [Holophagales bacterium]|nr:hypothetical protein [Holophagales bacterium]
MPCPRHPGVRRANRGAARRRQLLACRHLGGVCGIPAAARAVACRTVTATQTSAAGYLVAYPADEAKPVTSTVHFAPGRTRASNTQLKLSTTDSGAVIISNESPAPAHVILDVSGYYQ